MAMERERLLRKASEVLGAVAGTGILAAAMVIVPQAQAQPQAQSQTQSQMQAPAQYAVSDKELQSSVADALGKDGKLQGTAVTSTAAQGVITLTGTVGTEDERIEAEQVAAGVSGVRSIQDNLNLSGDAAAGKAPSTPAAAAPAPPDAATSPQTSPGAQQPGIAPPPPAEAAGSQPNGMPPPPPSDSAAQQTYTPYPNGAASQPPAQSNYPPQQNGYPQQQGGYPQNTYPQNGYPQQGSAYPQQPGYSQYPQQPGYSQYPQRPYAQPPAPAGFSVTPQQQDRSGPVAIPAGTLLSVRISEPLSTTNLKGGEVFQATAASDIYANGVVAVPRGAVLTGEVVESKNAGPLGGSAKLDLKLTSIQLGANTYPVASDIWSSNGPSKTGYTATNAAGGAVFGAVVGAIAGGGVGAGVGALAGGATGVAISGATRGPRLTLPPEALLQFHVEQPLTVQPVPFAEAERIAASAPQQPVLRARPAYVVAPYPYRYAPYPYGYYYGPRY